jgi:F0F1-type ATP synthase delta subunit
MTTLKKEDKIQIIEARLKAIEYKKYSLGIDLVVENNRSEPLEEAVTNLSSAIDECNNQLDVLNSELAEVNELAE